MVNHHERTVYILFYQLEGLKSGNMQLEKCDAQLGNHNFRDSPRKPPCTRLPNIATGMLSNHHRASKYDLKPQIHGGNVTSLYTISSFHINFLFASGIKVSTGKY